MKEKGAVLRWYVWHESVHKKSERVNISTIEINKCVYPGGWTPSEYSAFFYSTSTES